MITRGITMEVTDVLILCAEVSVTLAGFAGIIATFQFRDEKKISREKLVGLSIIVVTALMDTFACILPLVLLSYDINETTTWGLSSGILAIPATMLLYKVNKDMRDAVRRKTVAVLYVSLKAMTGVVILLLIFNAMGVVFHRVPGPYITAVVGGMGLSSIMFALLLLRPLWWRLREQESSNAAETKPN